jgi:choline dehydrogenase-like flavoprotein
VFVDRTTGKETIERARVIFLCASTIESTRILLNSASARHPNGLGNSSGTLGHYLMDHPSIGVSGRLPSADAAIEPFGGAHSVCLPRFENLEHPRSEFIRGYSIWGGAQRRHPARPDSGARFLFHASCEMLPNHENRVTLDPDRKDAWGIPTVHIDCRYSENERAMLDHARNALHEMLEAADFQVERDDPVSTPGGWVHELGTARMGHDPRSSVLNGFNQAWDVPNLFVTDGASFPTSGSQNPTLTIAALTVRACAYAVESFRR